MELPTPPPAVARAGLRALKTVAMCDGELRPIERELIDAVRRHVLRIEEDIDGLPGIAPAELAEAVPSPAFRRRILGGCAMLVLIDGDADATERALIEEMSSELGIKDPTLDAIRHYANRQMRFLRLDVARRFVGADRARKTLRDEGLRGLVGVLRDALRGDEDTELADRYRRLRDLPDDTLGRQYTAFMDENGFALPGEESAAPELIVFHDCHHVLAEYGTSPEEEAQIAAFHAGTHGQDPFGMLLFAVMQFQLGVQISPANEGYTGMVKPELLARAFMRGSKVPGDVIRDWDPREDFETRVDALRARFRIVPR